MRWLMADKMVDGEMMMVDCEMVDHEMVDGEKRK